MLLVLSLFFGYVYGVEYITECGDITEPGEYVIANDIDASDYFAEIPPGHGRYCIRIMSDDVVLDGNGHTIHSNETYERFRPIYVLITSGQYNITISDLTLRNGSIVVQNTSLLTIEHVNLSSLIYLRGRDARFSDIHADSIQVGNSMVGIEEDEVTPTVTNLTVTYSVFNSLSFTYVSNSKIAYSNGSISLDRSVNNHLESNIITGHHIGIYVRGGSNWVKDNMVCSNSVDYKCEESAVLIEEGVNYGEAVEGCDLYRLSSCGSECDDHDSAWSDPHLISSWITITSPFTGTSNLYDYCDESDPAVLYEGVCGDVRYEVVNCTEEYGEGFVCEEGACRREGSPPTCSCTDGDDPYTGGICTFYPEGPDHPGEPYPDTCTDEYHLTEYYCDGTSIASQEYDCREFGMVCLTDSYGFGYCGEPEEPTCLDSDLGGDDERYLPGMVSFGSDMMNDTCLDNRTLQEAYCGEDGRPATRIITCECVETPEGLGFCQPCVDTDPEQNVSVPGECHNLIEDTITYDTCNGWLSPDITQYFCNDPTSCLNGTACVQVITPCPEGESCIEFDDRAVCCDYDDLLDSIFSGDSTMTCSDSDGGLNYLTQGSMHFEGHADEGVCGSEGGDINETITDTCIDSSGNPVPESDQLLETYCEERHVFFTTFLIPNYQVISCSETYGEGWHCENGSCVNPECTDSDGGLVVGVFGSAESGDLTCSDTCLSDTLLSECVCGESGLGQETVDCSEMGMVCEGGRCVPTGETEPTCTELEDEENDVHVLGSVMYIDPEGSGFITYDTCNPSDIHSVYQVLCDGNEVSTVLTPCPEGEHCEDGVCVGGSCVDHDGGIEPNIPSSCEDRSGEHPDTCSGDGVIEWYCGSDDLCHSTEVTCEYDCTDGACIYCEDPDGDNIWRLGVCRSTFVNLTDRCDGSMVWEAVCMDGTCVYLDGKNCPSGTCVGGRCVPDWWFPPQGPISLPNLSIEDIHGYMVD